MSKRMILGIAAGVVAGATVIGVPAVAFAGNGPGGGAGAPSVGSVIGDRGSFQQMRQWMDDPQHFQQMRQWMDDPQHWQEMGSMMDGVGAGAWAGMHGSGGEGAQPTP